MSGISSIVPTAYAADPALVTAFGNAVNPIITNVVNPVIELAFAVAVLVFAYGVLQMVFHGTDAEAHTHGKWAVLGGIIGMFIMVSAWGIIYVISNSVKGFQ